ncbi:hypothetical protein BC941DRAFT_488812 [Chlamydoabsidia padenii]|nr:hypothetical protein BC941DRAFT_488812 [Chlamydoabsidia padenii]
MLGYVPAHRRNDDQAANQQQGYSIDGNKRSSYGQDVNNTGARYSTQQEQRGWRKSQYSNTIDDEDYSGDNSFKPHRNSTNRSSMSSFDPRMSAMLESLSFDDQRGSEDWDDLLRQYDRSDEEASAILARKNKRASRVMDPFKQSPALVPVVDATLILDCYDFPKSFKTHHLHDIFRDYENIRGGYRIKWMDDTRALIIFEHPSTAKKAYIDNVAHAYAKIRPYEGWPDFLPPSRWSTRSEKRGTIPDPLV